MANDQALVPNSGSSNSLIKMDAVIASGASLSAAVALGGLRLFGIVIPAAWTAAGLSFQTSIDGGTSWNNLKGPDGTEITATVAAGDFIALDPVSFAALGMLKVRSGTAGTPVNQAAARTLKLVLRNI